MNSSRWLPTALYFAVILLLSSIPPSSIPSDGFLGLDKIVHVLIYAIFGLCLAQLRWHFLRAWLLGASLAALDEAYQHFVSGRTAEFGDWLADGVGLALGLALAIAFAARSTRYRSL
jgi:VanZ family protein